MLDLRHRSHPAQRCLAQCPRCSCWNDTHRVTTKPLLIGSRGPNAVNAFEREKQIRWSSSSQTCGPARVERPMLCDAVGDLRPRALAAEIQDSVSVTSRARRETSEEVVPVDETAAQ